MMRAEMEALQAAAAVASQVVVVPQDVALLKAELLVGGWVGGLQVGGWVWVAGGYVLLGRNRGRGVVGLKRVETTARTDG